MKTLICRFIKDRSGATAIEYGLIIALIGAGLISGMTAFSGGITNMMDMLANHIKNSQ